MNKKIKITLLLVTTLLFTGCLTNIAKFEDLPQKQEEVEYKKYSEINSEDSKNWTSKTSDKYYISIGDINEDKLLKAITTSLEDRYYIIEKNNLKENYIWAKKGMGLNEYESIFGVYYKIKDKGYEIYIENHIAQSITGGWSEHRSKDLSDDILKNINR